MVEVANYIYGFAAACAAAIGLLAGVIMSLSSGHARLARAFVVASAVPLFLLPVTFGWTHPEAVTGLTIAALSAFVLGMIYYVGLSILDEHLKNAEKNNSKRRGS